MISFSLTSPLAQSLTILGLVSLCNWMLMITFYKIKKNKILNDWCTLLLDAAYMPLHCLIWVFGLFTLYYQVSRNDSFYLVVKNIDQIQQVAFSIPFCWFLFRLKQRSEYFIISKYDEFVQSFDPMLISILSKIATMIVAGTSCALILYFVGIPMQSLMMLQGALSLALGVAAHNILGNGFGGLMILMNRPFKVGDWISSPDRQIEGIVEEIRWDATKIMNFDRRPLFIPNSVFTKIIVVNSSHMYNRHIRQIINLPYNDADKIDAITAEIKSMLQAHQEIDQRQLFMADWVDFGVHALQIEVSAFTKTIDRVTFRKTQQEICIKIAQIIKQHGTHICAASYFVSGGHEKERFDSV